MNYEFINYSSTNSSTPAVLTKVYNFFLYNLIKTTKEKEKREKKKKKKKKHSTFSLWFSKELFFSPVFLYLRFFFFLLLYYIIIIVIFNVFIYNSIIIYTFLSLLQSDVVIYVRIPDEYGELQSNRAFKHTLPSTGIAK